MNSYIERSKSVVLDYLSKAKACEAKIEEGKHIYLPDSMEKEEKRLRGELAKARKEAEAKLDSVYQEASAQAREWSRLDGSKLTPDADLLRNQGVSPSEFDQLVERYQDNYTMLNTLKKYGEAENKKARQAGNFDVYYNVMNIPGQNSKMLEWDNMRKRADYFLNCADGNGFSSDFEKGFARNTADKAFEAWGEEPPKAAPANPDEIADSFRKAWGFVKE